MSQFQLNESPFQIPSLNGKKVLVSGASFGNHIGYVTAQMFRLNNCSVTVLVRSEEKGKLAVQELLKLKASTGAVFYVVGDLEKPETMADCVKKATEQMGGLDMLVISGPNANSPTTKYLGLDPLHPDSHRLLHTVAVVSPLILCEEFKNQAVSKQSSTNANSPIGSICIVSSMAAETAWPQTMHYNVAKAAQDCLIKNLAFQYASLPIRVNGVSVAAIHTEALTTIASEKNVPVAEYASLRGSAHLLNRIGHSEDVANMIVYLSSSLANFMTGEIVKVDAGLSCSNWFNASQLLKRMGK